MYLILQTVPVKHVPGKAHKHSKPSLIPCVIEITRPRLQAQMTASESLFQEINMTTYVKGWSFRHTVKPHRWQRRFLLLPQFLSPFQDWDSVKNPSPFLKVKLKAQKSTQLDPKMMRSVWFSLGELLTTWQFIGRSCWGSHVVMRRVSQEGGQRVQEVLPNV